MSSPERKSGSPSERIIRAWRKMYETGQIRFYMASSQQEIENLKTGGREVDGHKHVIEYFQALQEWFEGLK